MKGAKILLGLLLMAFPSFAADVSISPTGPVFQLQPAAVWGQSGPQGFNNNFYFTPLALNESVCVFVYNNNPTNPHSFTASIQVTGNPAEITPSDNTWQNTAASASLTAFTSPGLPGGIGGQVSGAAKVAIAFSASTTQAGSPDTASITIVQTPGNCFAGGQMLSSSPGTVSAVPGIQAISEGLSQSFNAIISATNPTANQLELNVSAGSGPRAIYFNTLTVVCSVQCSINVFTTTGNGTGCSTTGNVNERIGSSITSFTVETVGNCTTNPTQIGTVTNTLTIAAGVPYTLDLKGWIANAGTVNGISVVMQAGITGTIGGNLNWYEK